MDSDSLITQLDKILFSLLNTYNTCTVLWNMRPILSWSSSGALWKAWCNSDRAHVKTLNSAIILRSWETWDRCQRRMASNSENKTNQRFKVRYLTKWKNSCQAQVQSQIQVPNPKSKVKSTWYYIFSKSYTRVIFIDISFQNSSVHLNCTGNLYRRFCTPVLTVVPVTAVITRAGGVAKLGARVGIAGSLKLRGWTRTRWSMSRPVSVSRRPPSLAPLMRLSS